MKRIILGLILSLILTGTIHAQTSEQNFKKEIGIRLSGFDDFDFIYKKQKAENEYKRVRLISSNFYLSDFEDINHSLSLGLTIGKEKRKALNEDLSIYKGWEVIGRFQSLHSNDDLTLFFFPGIGLVLGFQFNLNKNFLVNLETIPRLTSTIQHNSAITKLSNLNLGFDSNDIALGLMYRF